MSCSLHLIFHTGRNLKPELTLQCWGYRASIGVYRGAIGLYRDYIGSIDG